MAFEPARGSYRALSVRCAAPLPAVVTRSQSSDASKPVASPDIADRLILQVQCLCDRSETVALEATLDDYLACKNRDRHGERPGESGPC